MTPLIRSAEEVEEVKKCHVKKCRRIEEAAEKGELDELVLMIIWKRLDLARRDVNFVPCHMRFCIMKFCA